MNEPYRPQPPEPPPQQSFPGAELPAQVVRMWSGERVIPLLGSACALVLLGVQIRYLGRDVIVMDVIMFLLFVLGIVLAFRRKATLTTQHLVVRKFFRTQVLPLSEVVHTFEGSRYSGVGIGWTGLMGIVTDLFFPKPVTIKLQDNRMCETKSFGRKTMEAQMTILAAAKAAGSPVDI